MKRHICRATTTPQSGETQYHLMCSSRIETRRRAVIMMDEAKADPSLITCSHCRSKRGLDSTSLEYVAMMRRHGWMLPAVVQSFVTGRHYAYKDGQPVDQRIEWVPVGNDVFFRDSVRHITGKIDISTFVRLGCGVTNADVIDAYDRCKYDCTSNYETAQAFGEEVSR